MARALSAPHRLARRHSAKTLRAAHAARAAAELRLNHQGEVPLEHVEREVRTFEMWLVSALDDVREPMPRRRHQDAVDGDEDEDDEG